MAVWPRRGNEFEDITLELGIGSLRISPHSEFIVIQILMSPGKCLSGLDTLAVTSHAHNAVTNQRPVWARMWPIRELGDRVSGLGEFLGIDGNTGMRCYKVRPRMLPLSSDGCWLCHFWPIRAQRLLTLANQPSVQNNI